jgi:hypothetical protein
MSLKSISASSFKTPITAARTEPPFGLAVPHEQQARRLAGRRH